MAVWINLTEEQKKQAAEWIAACPQVVIDMVAKYNLSVDKLYRMKETGQRVTLIALGENDTVRVGYFKDFNLMMFSIAEEREIFGVNPADLEECDYPKQSEVMFAHWHPVLEGSNGETLTNWHTTMIKRLTKTGEHPDIVAYWKAKGPKLRARYRKGKEPKFFHADGRKAKQAKPSKTNVYETRTVEW